MGSKAKSVRLDRAAFPRPLVSRKNKTRKEDKMQRYVTVAVMLCLLTGCALLFTGCAGEGGVATSSATRTLSASELAMVGTWVGAGLRVTLAADGTLTCVSGEAGPGSGTWSVSGSQYTDTRNYAGGSFSSSGTVSGNTISGTWSSGARSGPYTLTKQ
jgi:hypothetical protein